MPYDVWRYGNIVLDLTFDQQLTDPTSAMYQSLEMKVGGSIDNWFCHPFRCCSTSITSFREGSVVASFVVAIVRDLLTDCEIAENLIHQMNFLPGAFDNTIIGQGGLSVGKYLH